MALVTMTETQAIAKVRDVARQQDTTAWPDADIVLEINRFAQEMYAFMDHEGMAADFWASDGVLTETEATQAFTFPVDYYSWNSFYDLQEKRPITLVVEGALYPEHERFRNWPAGPVRAIQIESVTANSSTALRKGNFWPTPSAGYTPDIRIHYQRLPAIPGGAGNYYDMPLHLHRFLVLGTAAEIAIADDPIYQVIERRLAREARKVGFTRFIEERRAA